VFSRGVDFPRLLRLFIFFFFPNLRVDIDVIDVEKGGLFEADIDERRLHPGQDPRHAAFVDVSDNPFFRSSFDQELLDLASL